jgi:hypothetical protein
VANIVLKTCELPRFTIDSQVINQYNNKSVVQTKLNWEPITMSFYDQQNDGFESFLWNYVKGQFDAPNGSKKPAILPLEVKIRMHKLSKGPMSGKQEDNATYTFGDSDDASKSYYLAPAWIVDAQHDTLDYSTSEAVLWTITLRYESVTVNNSLFDGASTNSPAPNTQTPTPTPGAPPTGSNSPTTNAVGGPGTPPGTVPPDAAAARTPPAPVTPGPDDMTLDYTRYPETGRPPVPTPSIPTQPPTGQLPAFAPPNAAQGNPNTGGTQPSVPPIGNTPPSANAPLVVPTPPPGTGNEGPSQPPPQPSTPVAASTFGGQDANAWGGFA